MTPGTYTIGWYEVQIGHTNDSFERNKIGVFVSLSTGIRYPPFLIPADTPQDQLEALVSAYIAVTKAIDQSRYQLNQYAQLN